MTNARTNHAPANIPAAVSPGALVLAGRDGARLALRPVRYEFASVPTDSPGRLWDANWIVVDGRAGTPDGRSWSFQDACLTTWEGRDLAQWLRAAATGDVPVEAEPQLLLGWEDPQAGTGTHTPAEPTAQKQAAGLIEFTEPNLAFSVADHGADTITLRAHLSLECRPPHGPGSDADIGSFTVSLTMTRTELAAAVDRWATALEPFPQR